MPWHNLSEFIPWILAIFFVLFLIACCSWLYRCIQKCDDQCPGILPARSPFNPNSPMTPFPNIRHTRNCESTRRLTCRRAVEESNNEPSSSILSSTSIVHYHGPKAPPYAAFADRPPPPTYEEACGSGIDIPSLSQQQATSVTNIDTEQTNPTENTEAVSVSILSPSDDVRDVANDVNNSAVIDTPQDEPLINDDDDDEQELNDIVIESTAVETSNRRNVETNTEAVSVSILPPSDDIRDVANDVNDSAVIDTPQDEPLINDDDDDEQELNDVVIESTAVEPADTDVIGTGDHVYL